MNVVMALVLSLASLTTCYEPSPDIGVPLGLIPDCPGVEKNATIRPESLPNLQVTVLRVTPTGTVRKNLPVATAHKYIASDKHFDFKNKKTVFYALGYLDASMNLHNQALCNEYSKRGYNVIISDTMPFLTHIYPKSVRISRVIGRKFGELLVKLTERGLRPERLELVGISLGAHIISFAAKYLFSVTGKKPARLTGLDPAGPCFRSLPPEEKFWHTDALKVDVLHTNIDGFGIADRLGHVDFYINGGEYQPSDIPFFPCLIFCSHLKSLVYWWQAIQNPKQFIAVKCDSIQEARSAKCYNNTELNYLGFNTDFSKEGIFYLPTHNEFPYYMGMAGLRPEYEAHSSVYSAFNVNDDFQV